MAVYKRPGSRYWWYKFAWNGEQIQETTKQTNKRVAEQMEAAHKTALAKGEVGIRERKPTPTLSEFAGRDFLPYVKATFAAKRNTRTYYEQGVKCILAYERLSGEHLDRITTEGISGFIAKQQERGLEVSSINRILQVLHRLFYLAQEWGKVDKVLPKVRMLTGENHRERVLSAEEEAYYLDAAAGIGRSALEAYEKARTGIRATQRGQEPMKPADPFLLRDVSTILLDCGLRPEECFRLTWEQIRDGGIDIQHGKTENARRRIPLSQRAAGVIEMRRERAGESDWVFPAGTRSGHIEPASIKRQHYRACKQAKMDRFPLYTLRHTCLTRWAPHMDPWTLAYLAGHRDMAITRRYVHPQQATIRAALEKAQNASSREFILRYGEKSGISEQEAEPPIIN